jgi:hypothetical protein
MSSNVFYWIGDPRIVSISSWRADIAWYCSAEPESLDLIEERWGGPDGDENSVELITLDGVPVGTLDRMITREELSALVLARATPNMGTVSESATTQFSSDAIQPTQTAKTPVKKPRRRKRDRNQGELLLPIAGAVSTRGAGLPEKKDEEKQPAKESRDRVRGAARG